MTFPVNVASSIVETSNGAGTSHSVVLPAVVTAGDRLIVVLGMSQQAGAFTVTWDNSTAGTWTQVFDVGTADEDRGVCYAKIADGTEDGLTLTVTTSASAASEAVAFRVTGAHASAAIEATTDATQNSATQDPPSLTPSWGAADTLWLALAMAPGGTRTYDAFPTDYVDTGYHNNDGVPGAVVGFAWRSINATSQDPSAFTLSAAVRPVVATLAIRPAAAGGATGRGRLVGGKLVGGNLVARAA